jgi:hypothetical protein
METFQYIKLVDFFQHYSKVKISFTACLSVWLEEAAEPPLRQIIEVLEQVMCTHDAEKLAISVLEIDGDGHREGRPSDS